MSYNDIVTNTALMGILKENGADLNIIDFAFNFRDKKSGEWNKSLKAANAFNRKIYDRCSVKLYDNIHDYRFVTSATRFPRDNYGIPFFSDYTSRLLREEELTSWDADEVYVMRSVIMDPWLAENDNGKPFVIDIVAELGAIVCEVARDIGKT